MPDNKTPPVVAKKSHSVDKITLSIQLRCSGGASDRARIDASTEMTVEQARLLASSLVVLADQADAKATAKVASEKKRQQWRDREIAAGRMIVLTGMR